MFKKDVPVAGIGQRRSTLQLNDVKPLVGASRSDLYHLQNYSRADRLYDDDDFG